MERVAYTISEVCESAGTSRTAVYDAIKRGELVARKRGRRTLVLVDDLKKWVDGLPKLSAPASKELQPTLSRAVAP
jgi:excisionase family DNA binding protein